MKLARVSLGEVNSLCTRALAASGLYSESVDAIARTITAAERDGCQSHGLFRLPGYCNALRGGKCDPSARPVLHDAAQAVVRVDAGGGPAPYALEVGVAAVAERARQSGVGVLAVTNAFHFSALWHEVEALADQGLVGIAVLNSKSFVVHHGATRGATEDMVYGTNPMAFAFPRPDGLPPLVWDQVRNCTQRSLPIDARGCVALMSACGLAQASAAMARGEISMHEQAGASLPPGCAIDLNGNPTVDPATALAGAQLTFGLHKGSAIAMMVVRTQLSPLRPPPPRPLSRQPGHLASLQELLTAGLTGGAFSFEAREEVPLATLLPALWLVLRVAA